MLTFEIHNDRAHYFCDGIEDRVCSMRGLRSSRVLRVSYRPARSTAAKQDQRENDPN
jgi:hypothetical protein